MSKKHKHISATKTTEQKAVQQSQQPQELTPQKLAERHPAALPWNGPFDIDTGVPLYHQEKAQTTRNYLSFSMFEQVTDEHGNVIRENFVDDMAGRDSGGEGQNPKYVALLAGFAMLYMQQSKRDSKIKLVLLDEAFSKMDQERSAVCLKYARKMDLQLIVCVPDERLQSLIRNVDCVYGFRRYQNRISRVRKSIWEDIT